MGAKAASQAFLSNYVCRQEELLCAWKWVKDIFCPRLIRQGIRFQNHQTYKNFLVFSPNTDRYKLVRSYIFIQK